MKQLGHEDRARLVIAQVQAELERGADEEDADELVIRAVQAHSTGPEDAIRLFEAVKRELGISDEEARPATRVVNAPWAVLGALASLAAVSSISAAIYTLVL